MPSSNRFHLLFEVQSTEDNSNITNIDLFSLFSTTVSSETKDMREATCRLGESLVDFNLCCDFDCDYSNTSGRTPAQSTSAPTSTAPSKPPRSATTDASINSNPRPNPGTTPTTARPSPQVQTRPGGGPVQQDGEESDDGAEGNTTDDKQTLPPDTVMETSHSRRGFLLLQGRLHLRSSIPYCTSISTLSVTYPATNHGVFIGGYLQRQTRSLTCKTV